MSFERLVVVVVGGGDDGGCFGVAVAVTVAYCQVSSDMQKTPAKATAVPSATRCKIYLV